MKIIYNNPLDPFNSLQPIPLMYMDLQERERGIFFFFLYMQITCELHKCKHKQSECGKS